MRWGADLTRLLLVALLISSYVRPARAVETLVFYAAVSGKQTLDQGEGGSNPFANSLIEVPRQSEVLLSGLPMGTMVRSKGFLLREVPPDAVIRDRPLIPAARGERRVALASRVGL